VVGWVSKVVGSILVRTPWAECWSIASVTERKRWLDG